MTTKHVMLGKTSSIQYTWHTKNGDIVAKFKIWDWWDGKNISDLEISEKYRGLGLSYQLLDYATKRCGARNLAVEKSNTTAKYVYDKYGFQVTDEDDAYHYMSLSKGITKGRQSKRGT
jgi:ribosomal protein S18 acetylase RimI-like enzyme